MQEFTFDINKAINAQCAEAALKAIPTAVYIDRAHPCLEAFWVYDNYNNTTGIVVLTNNLVIKVFEDIATGGLLELLEYIEHIAMFHKANFVAPTFNRR